jgi:probable HAF family extracellular repeat protein
MKRLLGLMVAAASLVACRDGLQPVAPLAADKTTSASAGLSQYQAVAIQLPSEYSAGLAVAINNHNQVVVSATTVADGTRRALLWDDGVTQDLGTLGASSTVPTDINDRGQVVGWSRVDGSNHAFFWDHGTMQDLGQVVVYSSDKPEVNQVRINERGQVLGNRPGAQAFLWENGVTQDVALDFAAGFNDRGQVAGWVWHDDAGIRRTRAAMWEDGVVTDLGTLGGNESAARAISNSGWVVGGSRIAPNEFGTSEKHAFRWRGGRMEDLGRSGEMSSGLPRDWQAHLVNDPGEVGAKSVDLSFVWDHGLTSRLACNCTGGSAAPMDMNLHGVVVGYGAWVWEDGVLQRLGDGLTRTVAINDRGTVTGYRLSVPMIWLRQ